MSNKTPPKPKVCIICKEEFYGRKDAKTCSSRCRKRLQLSKKEVTKNE